MLLNLLLTTALSISLNLLYSQKKFKQFVKQNTVAIKSISPEATDYTDLETIGDAIGDSRLVMFGEQDHGDAPTFLAKTRLIKYLHEKKDFNVLAFESDFFALNYGWDQTEKISPLSDSLIYNSIYPIWTRCNACSHLFFNYIPDTYKTKSPLQLTGFDNQMSMGFSGKNLGKALDSVIRKLDLPIQNDDRYDSDITSVLNPIQGGGLKDTTLYHQRLIWLEEIKKQLADKLPPGDFWVQLVENVIQTNIQYQTTHTDRLFSMNVRDKTMAANLRWLINVKYPEEKIIVWAANSHIARDVGSFNFSLGPNKKLVTMGSLLANDSSINKNMYVLGFTSHHGEAGRLAGSKTKYTVYKPGPTFFESWIRDDFEYAFTNFQDYTERNSSSSEPYYLRGFGHRVLQKERWHKIFDGMFFIRNMYSCIE